MHARVLCQFALYKLPGCSYVAAYIINAHACKRFSPGSYTSYPTRDPLVRSGLVWSVAILAQVVWSGLYKLLQAHVHAGLVCILAQVVCKL